jgi:hypothetical protein
MAHKNIADKESSLNCPERDEAITVKSSTEVDNVGSDDMDGAPLEDDDLDGESCWCHGQSSGTRRI